MNGRKWYLCGVILLLRGLRVCISHATLLHTSSLSTPFSPLSHLLCCQSGMDGSWNGIQAVWKPPPTSPVRCRDPWVLALQVSGGRPRCAHCSGVARGALGLLRFSTAQQWRVGSQLLVPNVLSVSCKRFLSYIYFVGFSIAQNTKSEAGCCSLQLCLLSERLFPPSGKSPDVALATVPLPLPTPHGLSVSCI